MNRLTEIFETKRREVADAQIATPLDTLRSIVRDLPPTLDFVAAVTSSDRQPSLIAEVKAASPSEGVIRESLDVASVASAYAAAGAQALSVLTDRTYFGGAPENIALAKAASGLPALRKDFIESAYQLLEARAWGADAALLIVAALEPNQLLDLEALAMELGLAVLIETHDSHEVEIALRAQSPLIGVNNRNLATFEVDLGVSERLIPALPGRVAVAESGLSTFADVQRVANAGARTVLIGTAFCREPDVEAQVRHVMGWSAA